MKYEVYIRRIVYNTDWIDAGSPQEAADKMLNDMLERGDELYPANDPDAIDVFLVRDEDGKIVMEDYIGDTPWS